MVNEHITRIINSATMFSLPVVLSFPLSIDLTLQQKTLLSIV